MLKNCFLMGSQRDLFVLWLSWQQFRDFCYFLSSQAVVRVQLRASLLLLGRGRNLFPWPLLVSVCFLTKEHAHTQDFVRHPGGGSVDLWQGGLCDLKGIRTHSTQPLPPSTAIRAVWCQVDCSERYQALWYRKHQIRFREFVGSY